MQRLQFWSRHVRRSPRFGAVLAGWWTLRHPLIASNASIKPALEPVKLVESIGEGCCDVGSRFAVQALCLD
jgi:hypothetical protein